jgi:predicted RNA binding protein YcfA (HicA-like mRNA interferase family)
MAVTPERHGDAFELGEHLKADLRKFGFRQIPGRGKGSHTWWEHPKVPGYAVDLSGHDGDDAKPVQEQAVREARACAPKRKELR